MQILTTTTMMTTPSRIGTDLRKRKLKTTFSFYMLVGYNCTCRVIKLNTCQSSTVKLQFRSQFSWLFDPDQIQSLLVFCCFNSTGLYRWTEAVGKVIEFFLFDDGMVELSGIVTMSNRHTSIWHQDRETWSKRPLMMILIVTNKLFYHSCLTDSYHPQHKNPKHTKH